MFESIDKALDWLKDRAEEKGHHEVIDVTLDASNDALITCPVCEKGFWRHFTPEERRKWVIPVQHVCGSTARTLHVRRARNSDEVIALFHQRFPDERIVEIPVRHRNVRAKRSEQA